MIFLFYCFECRRLRRRRNIFQTNPELVFLEFLFHLVYASVQDFLSLVDKNNMIANLFYLFHAMRTENNAATFFSKIVDLILDKIRVHGVESAKRFVQNDQFRLM